MNAVFQYMYCPFILGSDTAAWRTAARLCFRYRLRASVLCESEAARPSFSFFASLHALPMSCTNDTACTALKQCAEECERQGYLPLLFLSPTWKKRLCDAERSELETYFAVYTCGDTTLFKDSRLLYNRQIKSERRTHHAAL